MTNIRMPVRELHEIVVRVLAAHGLAPPSAAIVVNSIVGAERDGTLSHGLLRVPGYISSLQSGWIDGAAVPLINDASPGVLTADARNGFAQVALAAAMDQFLAKVRHSGTAILAIRNSHHFGSLYLDIEPLAEAGLVALAFLNSRSRIVPSGGVTKLYGSNPMAFACPRAIGPPLVFDQASSVMAQGEVLVMAQKGKTLPEGAGLDKFGHSTTDPVAVLDGGALLPFGGHKGSSIALMVELLAAAVTGAAFGFEDGSLAFEGAQTSCAGQLIIAIDPARSSGAVFRDRVEELLTRIPGNGAARLPGDRRGASRGDAERYGVPLEQEAIDKLRALLPV